MLFRSRRVNSAYSDLVKNYPNPTAEQKRDALLKAGVSRARVEEETGIAAGQPAQPMQQPAQPPAQPQMPMAGNVPPAVAKLPPAPGQAKPTVSGIGPKPTEPTIRPPYPGERKDQYDAYVKRTQEGFKSELELYNKKQDRMEKEAEDLVKVKGKAEESIAIVNDLLTHPGFSDVIGMPNILTGIYSPPGSDARNFKSLYDQLKGTTFLSAYDTLRGTGAISNAEGATARKAVAALEDPYISETEFRRNAKIYIDTIKRGINRESVKVGQPAPYPEVPTAEESRIRTTPQTQIRIIKRERIE